MNIDYTLLRQQLKIDCQNCKGLCCIALFFSKMDGFPEDKRAGIHCSHLDESFQCDIYNDLSRKHMKGCKTYDCFGAGQYVTQKYNDLDNQKIYGAFCIVLELQQMLCYLIDAELFHHNSQIQNLIIENEDIKALSLDELLHFDIHDYHQRVTHVLRPLCQQNKLFHKRHDKIYRSLDLSMMILIGEDYRDCTFPQCTFLGTDLRDCHFEGADLSQSLFLTQVQLNSAYGNQHTKIPDWLERPIHWRKIKYGNDS